MEKETPSREDTKRTNGARKTGRLDFIEILRTGRNSLPSKEYIKDFDKLV